MTSPRLLIIGSLVINYDAIDTINQNFRLTMAEGGGEPFTLIALTARPGVTYPQGYNFMVHVTGAEDRARVRAWLTQLEESGAASRGHIPTAARSQTSAKAASSSPTATAKKPVKKPVTAQARKNMERAQKKRWAEKKRQDALAAKAQGAKKTTPKVKTAAA